VSRFSAGTSAVAVVDVPRADVWAVLTDPAVVARLTPFVRRIVVVDGGRGQGGAVGAAGVSGELWRWEMTGLTVLGVGIAPTFTERMTYDEPARIGFGHEPPAGQSERAAVAGWYRLDELDAGTRLTTSMEITVDLPLPRVSAGAVRAALCRVIDQMGERFSQNLLAHLGARELD
jgi:carbon monoxide dehydrogenase subunit G